MCSFVMLIITGWRHRTMNGYIDICVCEKYQNKLRYHKATLDKVQEYNILHLVCQYFIEVFNKLANI